MAEGIGGEIVAEYTEVIKQFKRMCKSISPAKCTRGECPMRCENIGQCRKVAFERPAKFEEQVMTWAAEHPEPMYETWLEFIKRFETGKPKSDPDFIYWMGTTSIPDDIAQKLGIEPKEG